ncbi:hypothetical protein ABID39_001611, partial [Bartonella japonica]
QQDDWKIVPNLWGAIVGQPSTMKSPTMQAALEPLDIFEKEWYQEWIKKKKQQKTKEIFNELETKENKRKAYKALKNQDKEQALALLSKALEDNESEEDDSPIKRRLIVNDVTVEKLGELLKENPRGLLMVCDELTGFLANLERKEYQTDRAFYLKAFNGNQSHNYDRIGRGTIHIPNATLSIVGGIQPSRIIPLIQAIHRGINDDGLLQRFQMLIFPDARQERLWVDRPPKQEAWENYQKIFRLLYDKPLGSPKHPIIIRFAPKAQEKFRVWWEEFQKKINEGHFSTSLQAHLLKMNKTIPTLALIFELVEGGRFEVTLPSLHMALRWEKYLLSHIKRLYAAADNFATKGANLLIERCEYLPDGFTARDVSKRHWKLLKDNETIQQTLELLCRCNYLRKSFADKKQKVGRPTIHYEWHPLVKNQWTEQ